MRYILVCLALIASSLVSAETLAQLKARMLTVGGPIGVIAVGEDRDAKGTFMPGIAWGEGSPDIYYKRIVWLIDSGEVVKKDSKDVLFLTNGDPASEVVLGWVGEEPDFLKPATPDAYITGRTGTQQAPKTPFTKAQVETFSNAQWRGTQGNSAALDIKEFSVSNVDANTVRVTGLFHDVATNTRPRLTYLVTLVDPNGAYTGANVKFEKVIE
jgi:hypothetical protein